MHGTFFRPRKPSWTRSLRGSCSSRTKSAMRAIRSRGSSTSNSSSSSASSPMRSVRPQSLFRSNNSSNRAAARPRRAPPHNGKGTPWRMSRINLLSWRKVSPPSLLPSFLLIFGRRFGGLVADGEVAVVYGTLGRGRRHTHVTYRNDTDAQKQVANGRLAPWYQRSKPKFKNLINQGMLIFTLLFFFWFCYTAATAANSICTCASPSP